MSDKLNFIMIAPHFPENFSTFATRLKQANINTLGIGDVAYDDLSSELKENLVEYYKVENMENYDQMLKAVAFFTHKYGKIDRLESHNEHWLELDAKLRTDFNILGYKLADIDKIRNKSEMKKVFRSLDFKVAKGDIIKDLKHALRLTKNYKYPVIIKPDSGVGASDTYKIDNDSQLEAFFKNKNDNISYIMEQFIEGEIITFDGLCDINGRIVFSSTLEYKENVLDTVVNDNDLYYFISRTIDKNLRSMGEKMVKAFNVKERFFHFEFFKTKNKEYIPLEVNMRPPGGPTIDMFNYANDFDIFKEYANLVKGEKFSARLLRPYYCAYVSRKDLYHYKHDDNAIKNYLKDDYIDTLVVPGIFSAIMGDKGYLLKVKTKRKMFDYIDYIHKKTAN